jgi:hypothetical protein
MQKRWILFCVGVAVLGTVNFSQLLTQPSFNGSTAGCTGSGCHSLSASIATATARGAVVTIGLSGTTGHVAGELVDSTGTVVAVNNSSTSNPFTLTAPGPGLYRVNAGYNSPSRNWDSVMVRVISTTNVVEGVPLEFSLGNNYPNPFNPTTVIPFSVPQSSQVTLTLFDVLGREIETLVNGKLDAGHHSITLNASTLTTGVYIVRLQAGSREAVHKIVCLR